MYEGGQVAEVLRGRIRGDGPLGDVAPDSGAWVIVMGSMHHVGPAGRSHRREVPVPPALNAVRRALLPSAVVVLAGSLVVGSAAAAPAQSSPPVQVAPAGVTQVAAIALAAVPAASGFTASLRSENLRRLRQSAPYSAKTPDYARWYAQRYIQSRFGWDATHFYALRAMWMQRSVWNKSLAKPTGHRGIPRLTRAQVEQVRISWKAYLVQPEAQVQAGVRNMLRTYSTPKAAWAVEKQNPPYFTMSTRSNRLNRVRLESPHMFGTRAYNVWYANLYAKRAFDWRSAQRTSLKQLWYSLSRHDHRATKSGDRVGIPMLTTSQSNATGVSRTAYRRAPEVQVIAGARHIKKRYGTPQRALAVHRAGYFSTSLSASALAEVRANAKYRFASVEYNQWYAKEYMRRVYGWGDSHFNSLKTMWWKESNWRHDVCSPGCKYVGIPQTTLATAQRLGYSSSSYQANPETQIQAGLKYIKQRYGSPNAAWGFWLSNGWY